LLGAVTMSSVFTLYGQSMRSVSHFYPASNSFISYIGRVDHSDAALPRFWAPGVYVTAKFKGSFCKIVVNDEMLWGKNHNYLEIVVDGKNPVRIQTSKKTDTINIANGLTNGVHSFLLCKDTESNIGYIEIVGVMCQQLLPPSKLPNRRIEFVGNSITCGTGLDQSQVPCHTGLWQDQHNAYMSYGALTARQLNAQWHLTSVSGIGLTHSCCNLNMLIADVFDKVNLRENVIDWNFNFYQPQVVTLCLGQNDGIQDSAKFANAYIDFIKNVRSRYANASIICLTSPMANDGLKTFLSASLKGIIKKLNNDGDKKVSYYVFKKRYHNGCDEHPDMDEHRQIAGELSAYIKKLKKW
jgi:hypothetical protein